MPRYQSGEVVLVLLWPVYLLMFPARGWKKPSANLAVSGDELVADGERLACRESVIVCSCRGSVQGGEDQKKQPEE
jgi:hypothetical protein